MLAPLLLVAIVKSQTASKVTFDFKGGTQEAFAKSVSECFGKPVCMLVEPNLVSTPKVSANVESKAKLLDYFKDHTDYVLEDGPVMALYQKSWNPDQLNYNNLFVSRAEHPPVAFSPLMSDVWKFVDVEKCRFAWGDVASQLKGFQNDFKLSNKMMVILYGDNIKPDDVRDVSSKIFCTNISEQKVDSAKEVSSPKVTYIADLNVYEFKRRIRRSLGRKMAPHLTLEQVPTLEYRVQAYLSIPDKSMVEAYSQESSIQYKWDILQGTPLFKAAQDYVYDRYIKPGEIGKGTGVTELVRSKYLVEGPYRLYFNPVSGTAIILIPKNPDEPVLIGWQRGLPDGL